MSEYPTLGELELDTFGSWSGEAELASGHRIRVTYVCHPGPVPLRKVTPVAKTIVAQVARKEADYRLKAAQAWLGEFHRDADFARGWSDQDLAQRFVLREIILGSNDERVILEYESPAGKPLKTWFNRDGSLSHISGDLFE